jgi:hypothetical protein
MWELDQPPFLVRLSNGSSVKERQRRYPVTYGTMPPSFMVDRYKIEFEEVKYEKVTSKGYETYGYTTHGTVICIINHKLHNYVKRKWKEQSPSRWIEYMNYPPRFSLVERSVVENDVGLKLLKWINYRSELVRLGFPGHIDLAYEWVKNIHQNLSMGDHVKRYVIDHAEAHPVKGYTWNQLLKANLMDDLFEFTKNVTAVWLEHFYDIGEWCLDSESFNIGMRARSPDDIQFDYYVPFILTRGRQIGYNPGPSSVNAFVPHEKILSYMKKIFNYYSNELGCQIMCPKVDGGRVYTEIRNAYLNGEKISHYDVAGMELITPSIIYGDVRNFPLGLGMVIGRRGDMPELLSGVGPTSDWDMIAHLELLIRILVKPPRLIIILGDDATFIGDFKILNTQLYEQQDRDDRLVRTLGLTCNEFMHPVGRNITIDTANKRINVQIDQIIENKMPMNEREDIAEYFTGWIRGREVAEIIGKVKAEEEVYSPREMVEKAIGISATT